MFVLMGNQNDPQHKVKF